MAVETSWLDEGHIIYIRFYEDVNFDDIHVANQHSLELSTDRPNRVHVIVDFTTVRHFPTHINRFRDTIQMWKDFSNKGLVVFVAAHGLLHFVNNTVAQLAQLEFRMVDTMAEAELLINRVRQL